MKKLSDVFVDEDVFDLMFMFGTIILACAIIGGAYVGYQELKNPIEVEYEVYYYDEDSVFLNANCEYYKPYERYSSSWGEFNINVPASKIDSGTCELARQVRVWSDEATAKFEKRAIDEERGEEIEDYFNFMIKKCQ